MKEERENGGDDLCWTLWRDQRHRADRTRWEAVLADLPLASMDEFCRKTARGGFSGVGGPGVLHDGNAGNRLAITVRIKGGR